GASPRGGSVVLEPPPDEANRLVQQPVVGRRQGKPVDVLCHGGEQADFFEGQFRVLMPEDAQPGGEAARVKGGGQITGRGPRGRIGQRGVRRCGSSDPRRRGRAPCRSRSRGRPPGFLVGG